jgi:hypothetical protein
VTKEDGVSMPFIKQDNTEEIFVLKKSEDIGCEMHAYLLVRENCDED